MALNDGQQLVGRENLGENDMMSLLDTVLDKASKSHAELMSDLLKLREAVLSNIQQKQSLEKELDRITNLSRLNVAAKYYRDVKTFERFQSELSAVFKKHNKKLIDINPEKVHVFSALEMEVINELESICNMESGAGGGGAGGAHDAATDSL